jgi:hypothetical protein
MLVERRLDMKLVAALVVRRGIGKLNVTPTAPEISVPVCILRKV